MPALQMLREVKRQAFSPATVPSPCLSSPPRGLQRATSAPLAQCVWIWGVRTEGPSAGSTLSRAAGSLASRLFILGVEIPRAGTGPRRSWYLFLPALQVLWVPAGRTAASEGNRGALGGLTGRSPCPPRPLPPRLGLMEPQPYKETGWSSKVIREGGSRLHDPRRRSCLTCAARVLGEC